MTTERAGLLDVNVLLALAWPNHLHHCVAREWFAANRELGWATCPLTESAFVRISSHPRIGPEPRTVAESIAWLAALRAFPDHRFLSDDVSIVTSPQVPRDLAMGHRQITDAHLLALARRHDVTLVTFDRGIAALAPDPDERRRTLRVLGLATPK